MMIKAIRTACMISLLVPALSVLGHAEDTRVIDSKAGTQAPVEAAASQIPTRDLDQSQNPVQTYTVQPDDQYNGNFEFPLFQTVGGLGLVLCIIIGLYFAGKKYFPQYFQKSDSSKNLKLIETLSMGDRRSIAVIQVADKRFLVGNTPHQISLLSSISESESLLPDQDTVPSEPRDEVKEKSGNSFKNLFDFEKSRHASQSGSPLPEDVRTKMRLLREALER